MKIKYIGDEPTQGTTFAAGYDVKASKIIKDTIFAVWYEVDFKMEMPDGYAALGLPRSSISNDGCLMLANSPGLIDSDFRGKIQYRFNRTFKGTLLALIGIKRQYKVGERIGQLLFIRHEIPTFYKVYELSETTRNENGYGHTGL